MKALDTKKIFIIIFSVFLLSCNNNKKTNGEFKISGEIKNAPAQKIFLEEVFFSQKQPQVIDTAELANGKFMLTGIATEEGMYRLRLEKGQGYIFINDKEEIPASIDGTGQSLFSASFNTPANRSLQKFLLLLDSLQTNLKATSENLTRQSATSDSLAQASQDSFMKMEDEYKKFILNYIDTTASPIMALFVLGYTQGIEPALLNKAVAGAAKKFPTHHALNEIINQFKTEQAQSKSKTAEPAENTMAADFSLPDTQGKLVSLSSLRGKYVLVDFWASWCGPCRQENPNVVAAYKKFKDKNFTILGVSLDKEKSEWLQAIKDDGLTWNHVSDLKFWNSTVVPLYNIEGIPYNVLLDPTGKIIATSLRGSELQNKLAEVLK